MDHELRLFLSQIKMNSLFKSDLKWFGRLRKKTIFFFPGTSHTEMLIWVSNFGGLVDLITQRADICTIKKITGSKLTK